VAKTAPRWENREYLPLMFRKARAHAHAGSGEGTTEGTTSMAEEDASKVPARDGEPGVTRRTPVHCADHPGRDCELVEYADGGREHVALAEGDPGGIIRRYRAMWQNRNNQSETEGTTAMTTGTGPSYKGGDFSLTTSHRGGSKIAPEHRARRAAARTGGSMPAAWGPVIALAADFEPEDDGQLLDWMNGQVTGMGGYGEALVDLYDHCTSVIGIDPAAAALLHDVADAVAHAAESMAAAKAKFTDHYEMPREFAANGGLMTHDGRWVTGEGA
jgi:hypothetical protein